MLSIPQPDSECIPVSSAGQYWILRTLKSFNKGQACTQPLALKLLTLKLFSLTTGASDSYLAFSLIRILGAL